MGSDIYGMAALNACKELNQRLKPIREANPNASFKEIVSMAYMNRINLSAQGFFKVCASLYIHFKLTAISYIVGAYGIRYHEEQR
jgi:xanthine dehydrogenase molybdopterin-binding subunit B